MSRVTDLLKGAVELNLRYTSTLLHLSKDYLRDANIVLTQGPAPTPAPTTIGSKSPAAAARAPLLVVGRAGDTGNGAFAINNPSDREMNVHLVVQGELDEPTVSVEPARLTLKPGEGAIVRILACIDGSLAVDRDFIGSVVAPGLTNQGVPFIVRRLPDVARTTAPAASPAPRKTRASRSTS